MIYCKNLCKCLPPSTIYSHSAQQYNKEQKKRVSLYFLSIVRHFCQCLELIVVSILCTYNLTYLPCYHSRSSNLSWGASWNYQNLITTLPFKILFLSFSWTYHCFLNFESSVGGGFFCFSYVKPFIFTSFSNFSLTRDRISCLNQFFSSKI
jgi:hypothetical protein